MHCLGARASPCAHPRPGSAVRRAALRASPLRRSTVVFCKSEDADGDQPAIIKQAWQGSDQFSSLGDRKDEPPLPLPPIKRARTIYLVRHGQSTWNAEERIQGSSDLSVLTAKGVTQAQTTRRLLSSLSFDRLVYSPLARAAQTAEIIWEGRSGPKSMLPQLREIDLYEFQGLLKSQGKALFGDEYAKWQSAPSEFELKGRAPVR